jgi:polyisoprenoid-binding protein YceI
MTNTSGINALGSGRLTLNAAATSLGFVAPMFFGMKAKGKFDRYTATITVGDSAADSSVAIIIHSDSVDTGSKMRDKHLRADNVFACERFPTMEFRSTVVAETPKGLDVTGTLRVRDVTRQIRFHADWVAASTAPRYRATVPINPKEFGITRPGTTKPLDVLIDATLQRA